MSARKDFRKFVGLQLQMVSCVFKLINYDYLVGIVAVEGKGH